MRDLLDLVDRATADAPWDPGRLVAAASATGRARVRRRRAGATLATCAVLGVASTGLTMAVGDSTPMRGIDPAAQTAAPTSLASPTSAPTPAAARRTIAPGPAETGRLLAQALRAQGVGQVTDPTSWHEQPGEAVFRGGSVLVDGARVTLLIQPEVLDRCGEQPPGAACDSTGKGGFESVTSYDEPASGGLPSGIAATTASFFTGDHFTITATAYNASDEKGVAPTMASPVLDGRALLTLIEDEDWLTS